MSVIIPDKLPAAAILRGESIEVIDSDKPLKKGLPVIKIAILNLMPTKAITETQLLRLLGSSPLQVEVTLLRTESYEGKNTSREHLEAFYKTFSEIREKIYNGLIITGAPIEHLEFEEVEYWKELTEIFEWSKTNVLSTLHICWGAQAGLYHHYGMPKHSLKKKKFGIFPHFLSLKDHKLLQGFDDIFYVPHSRHTEVRRDDIEKSEALLILSESPESGVYMVASKDGKQVFLTGHSEYDRGTLKSEYARDKLKGLPISIPVNYFPKDDPSKEPQLSWRGHSKLLFLNWLNLII